MMSDLYTVIAIDGGVVEWVEDITIPSIKYSDLSWDEAVELCRLSFKNGFQCVLWRQDDGGTGGADHAKAESGTKL